jgi:hypothetical protein
MGKKKLDKHNYSTKLLRVVDGDCESQGRVVQPSKNVRLPIGL